MSSFTTFLYLLLYVGNFDMLLTIPTSLPQKKNTGRRQHYIRTTRRKNGTDFSTHNVMKK